MKQLCLDEINASANGLTGPAIRLPPRRCPGRPPRPRMQRNGAGSTGHRNTLIFYQGWSVDMKQRRRIYYSAAQRSEIWDRWQAGEPMSAIGRRFDRESSSVFSVISPTGGIRPPDRRRSKQTLSLSDRDCRQPNACPVRLIEGEAKNRRDLYDNIWEVATRVRAWRRANQPSRRRYFGIFGHAGRQHHWCLSDPDALCRLPAMARKGFSMASRPRPRHFGC